MRSAKEMSDTDFLQAQIPYAYNRWIREPQNEWLNGSGLGEKTSRRKEK